MLVSWPLPWPDTKLSPNQRQHWTKLAKAKKAYRQSCYLRTLEQISIWKGKLPEGDLVLTLTFVPPDKRKRDVDNLLARMKAGLDGVAEALGIDDSRFVQIRLEIESPARPAYVQITITGKDDESL